ncbi:MAG: hypothetical protein FWC64_03880, partial [Treponema sp.]|nr:hypothetical protein [Treponema sp.]
MKKTFKLLGIIAVAAIIGFFMTACGGTNGGGGDGGFGPPPIVDLTPGAIPSSNNPAFTNPGAGGRRTVAAADMDEVLGFLVPIGWDAADFVADGAFDYAMDNMAGASFSRQLIAEMFDPPLITAGISGLTGSISVSAGLTSFSASFNNVNYVYRSYQATHQWFLAPHGRTVVASARWSYT